MVTLSWLCWVKALLLLAADTGRGRGGGAADGSLWRRAVADGLVTAQAAVAFGNARLVEDTTAGALAAATPVRLRPRGMGKHGGSQQDGDGQGSFHGDG